MTAEFYDRPQVTHIPDTVSSLGVLTKVSGVGTVVAEVSHKDKRNAASVSFFAQMMDIVRKSSVIFVEYAPEGIEAPLQQEILSVPNKRVTTLNLNPYSIETRMRNYELQTKRKISESGLLYIDLMKALPYYVEKGIAAEQIWVDHVAKYHNLSDSQIKNIINKAVLDYKTDLEAKTKTRDAIVELYDIVELRRMQRVLARNKYTFGDIVVSCSTQHANELTKTLQHTEYRTRIESDFEPILAMIEAIE